MKILNFKDFFAKGEILWCLFIKDGNELYPIYYKDFGEKSFWRGGSNVCLAAYPTSNSAYAGKSLAKQEFKEEIVVKKIIVYLKD